jgi:hypothetical protein
MRGRYQGSLSPDLHIDAMHNQCPMSTCTCACVDIIKFVCRLDLHYWRKECKHCHCAREFHDIAMQIVPSTTTPSTPARKLLCGMRRQIDACCTSPSQPCLAAKRLQNPEHDVLFEKCTQLKTVEQKDKFQELQALHMKHKDVAEVLSHATSDDGINVSMYKNCPGHSHLPWLCGSIEVACHRCDSAFEAPCEYLSAPLVEKTFHKACFTCTSVRASSLQARNPHSLHGTCTVCSARQHLLTTSILVLRARPCVDAATPNSTTSAAPGVMRCIALVLIMSLYY